MNFRCRQHLVQTVIICTSTIRSYSWWMAIILNPMAGHTICSCTDIGLELPTILVATSVYFTFHRGDSFKILIWLIMNWVNRSRIRYVDKKEFYYLRSVLAFGYCLHLCVCVSVCQSQVCLHDNLWPVLARITKFEPEMQNTLVKICIVVGGDWPWPPRSKLT